MSNGGGSGGYGQGSRDYYNQVWKMKSLVDFEYFLKFFYSGWSLFEYP
jgi:hypothetical protein